jgi:hypothetical protein
MKLPVVDVLAAQITCFQKGLLPNFLLEGNEVVNRYMLLTYVGVLSVHMSIKAQTLMCRCCREIS